MSIPHNKLPWFKPSRANSSKSGWGKWSNFLYFSKCVTKCESTFRRWADYDCSKNWFDSAPTNWKIWWQEKYRMCHMHGRICFWWLCEISTMPSYLSYQMHRWLANAELHLPVLHGASGRGTYENVGKPILNKECVVTMLLNICDVCLEKVYPVRYVHHVEQLPI